MHRLIRVLLFVLLFAGLGLFNMGGCGGSSSGGGEDCDFSINDVTNGPDSFNAFSLWACVNDLDEEFNFSVFDNGKGVSDGIGIFTWERTGCRSASVDGELASGEITNIEGSISIGLLAFDQQLNQVPINSSDCVLIVF